MLQGKRYKALVIVGPTGVGKSGAAIEAAKLLNGEIISADSMQVYIGMDIGTDKPDPIVLKAIPHHLISVVDLSEDFSVARYQEMARAAIREINERGRLPVLVGGSGLYVRAAVDSLEFPAGEISSPFRRRLNKEDPQRLWQQLKDTDPEAAAKIPAQNVRRVVRALEVMRETGELFSDRYKRWRERESIFNTFFVGLSLNRAILYQRIEMRVDEMMRRGFLDEVKRLVQRGLKDAVTAGQALGYKELIDHLDGLSNLDAAVNTIKQRTRQFAKRQLTWFRADPRIHWLSVEDKDAHTVAEEIKELVTAAGFIV